MYQASVALLLSFCYFAWPVHAQKNDSLVELQARQAAEVAMKATHAEDTPAQAERRTDLENELLYFDAKTSPDHVYFYDERPAAKPFDSATFRLVAVTPSTREVYRLSGFEASPATTESLEEFNRLTSKLRISIAKERAISLASLFLNTTDPAGRGVIPLDDEAVWVRLAIENYYMAAYGDFWRALDAYAGWWEQFRATAPELAPVIKREDNESYRVGLKRLVRYPERQPEMQNWELEVSRNGEIRVLSMQLIFPVHPNWMFYDVRGISDSEAIRPSTVAVDAASHVVHYLKRWQPPNARSVIRPTR